MMDSVELSQFFHVAEEMAPFRVTNITSMHKFRYLPTLPRIKQTRKRSGSAKELPLIPIIYVVIIGILIKTWMCSAD